MYKLNLHAHSLYSDGHCSIKTMAEKYKELGFTCAVITDHLYSSGLNGVLDTSKYSLNYTNFMHQLIEADAVSKELNFPIILGIERTFFKSEEVLCFGAEFIKELFNPLVDLNEFFNLKNTLNGVAIIAHPIAEKSIDMGIHDVVDGYESFNGGCPMFGTYRTLPTEFEKLTAFSNSDAHGIITLDRGYNLTETPITTETELIEYIKNKRPIKLFPI